MEPLLQNQGFKKKIRWSARCLMVEHLDDRDYFMQKCLGERLTTECGLMRVKESIHPKSHSLTLRFSFTCSGKLLSIHSLSVKQILLLETVI